MDTGLYFVANIFPLFILQSSIFTQLTPVRIPSMHLLGMLLKFALCCADFIAEWAGVSESILEVLVLNVLQNPVARALGLLITTQGAGVHW